VAGVALTVDLERGRRAFAESVESFVRAVDGFDEYALLGSSRCHGWTRLDAVVHVIAGWTEMLGGLVSVVDTEPTVDAASYWPAFAAEYAGDPLPPLLAQRRRTTAYARPASAVEQLHDVAAAMLRGAEGVRDVRYLWQAHVFEPGDFLAIWAVEDVIHHLDLLSQEPPPADALELARSTVEALAGATFPEAWAAQDVVLVGTGRLPVPDGLGALGDRLPVLG
jgi:hypothetical protein